MKIYQLYYTFCKKGLSKENDFQTYSMSDGINEEEKDEIEEHCFGMHAVDLCDNPLSFSLFKLKSGKNCICRTKCKDIAASVKTQDYFCHVLVLEDKEIMLYPYKTSASKIFKDELTEEEKDSGVIKPLPTLDSIPEDEFAKASDIEEFNEKAVKVLELANKYALETLIENIAEKLDEEVLGNVILNVDLNILKVVFQFLFRAAKVTGKKDYKDKAYEFFFNAIQFIVVNNEEIDIEDIMKLYDDIRRYNEDDIKDFVSKSIENKRLLDAKAYLDSENSRYALFFISSILKNFIFLNNKQNSKIPWQLIMKIGIFEELTETCLKILVKSKREISFALEAVLEDDDYFANLVIMSYKFCSSRNNYDTVIAAYSEVLDEILKDRTLKIIKQVFDKKGGGEILIFAYKYKMKKIGKREEYFRYYCLNIFDENPEYRRKYFSLALEELILNFKDEDFDIKFYREFTEYVGKRKLEKYIGKFLAARLVNKFQNLVLIKVPDEKEKSIIEEMNFLNNYYEINVSPNISEMIHYAEVLFTGSVSVEDFLCDEKKFQFNGIDEVKYEKVLRLIFEIVCPKLDGTLAHIKMKNILMYDRYFVTYFNTYINTMNDILTSNGIYTGNKTSYKLYLDFIYFIIKCKALFSEEQFKDIERFIFESMEKVGIDNLKGYEQYIKDIITNTSKSEEAKKIRKEWQKIYKNLNDEIRKRHILEKLHKIYKRKIKD